MGFLGLVAGSQYSGMGYAVGAVLGYYTGLILNYGARHVFKKERQREDEVCNLFHRY